MGIYKQMETPENALLKDIFAIRGGGCSCLPLTSLLPLGLEENKFMMWIISICLFRAVKIMEQGVTFRKVLNSLRYKNNVSQCSNNCMNSFCF